jgi:Family of unknown function (DUF6090)
MIRFFKNVRQQLASENKVVAYLRYAVGEILLVVIGILIALQVNNWNANRKQHIDEIKILQNIKKSVEEDMVSLKWQIISFDIAAKSIEIILKSLKQDLAYNDSLNFHFANTTQLWAPQINTEVFESLSSTDLNVISNDSLKLEIISYYSLAKGNFTVLINRYTNIIENASKNIFNTRFNAMWNGTWEGSQKSLGLNGYSMIPNNFDSLKKDKVYIYFLATLKNQMHWYMQNPLRYTKRAAESLLKSINRELELNE